MRKWLCVLLAAALLLLNGCGNIIPTEPTWIEMTDAPTFAPETESTERAPATEASTIPETEPTEIPTTVPETEPPTEPTTMPEHSAYYIPGLDVETLITYFNEVVLDSEYIISGNATLVQKWDRKIWYVVYGEPTGADRRYIRAMEEWLNSIPGFPGMEETANPDAANLQIYFVDQQGLVNQMGEQHWGNDGAVTFWYESDRIYQAVICCRTDIDQYTRNSVIMEEIYNGMGPIQDTDLRPDSLIYSGFSTPQELTAVDELIMTLLYHPDMAYSMNAAQCAEVIRNLYY